MTADHCASSGVVDEVLADDLSAATSRRNDPSLCERSVLFELALEPDLRAIGSGISGFGAPVAFLASGSPPFVFLDLIGAGVGTVSGPSKLKSPSIGLPSSIGPSNSIALSPAFWAVGPRLTTFGRVKP